MDNKITPGTWIIATGDEYDFHHLAVFSGITKIADVLHDPDAALIAAAPDLLDALKLAIDALEESALFQTCAISEAKKAIAKAEGGEDHG